MRRSSVCPLKLHFLAGRNLSSIITNQLLCQGVACQFGLTNCRIQPSHLDINNKPAKICTDNNTGTWVHGTNLSTYNNRALINNTKLLNLHNDQSTFPDMAASCSLNGYQGYRLLCDPYLKRLKKRNLQIIKEVKDEIVSVDCVVMTLLLAAVCCAPTVHPSRTWVRPRKQWR